MEGRIAIIIPHANVRTQFVNQKTNSVGATIASGEMERVARCGSRM